MHVPRVAYVHEGVGARLLASYLSPLPGNRAFCAGWIARAVAKPTRGDEDASSRERSGDTKSGRFYGRD